MEFDHNQFHSVVEVEDKAAALAGLKKFVGDGSPVLRVTGLTNVRRVFIDSQEIPLQITEKVIKDESGATEDVTLDMIKLTRGADGNAILLRSKKSNDGIWQSGCSVYIDGDMDGESDSTGVTPQQKAAATKAVKDAEKGLADAKTDEEKAAATAKLEEAKAARAALD